jgi:zinc protease
MMSPALLLPVPDDPTVSFRLWLRAGSRDDPPGREGLARLTGLMVGEAATETNSYQAILEKLYPLASGYGLGVDREMSTLAGRTHRDNLEAYLELFTDAWLRPAFDEVDLERHRKDLLNGIENSLRYASDEELAKAALYGYVFEGSSYRHPSLGTVAGLEAVTLEEVRRFHERHYLRRDLLVGLGGGFPSRLPAELEGLLAGLPEGAEEPAAPDPPAPFEGRQVLLVDKPGADASISLGFPLEVRRGERDFYALWLANSWLGEHRNSSSRLFQVIRERRGLNYGDYSYIEAFPGGGGLRMPPTGVARRRQIFEIWIRTLPNENALFALRAALRELDRLVREGLSEEQFALTRSFLRKYSAHFAETTAARLGYAVDDRFYGLGEEGHLARFRRMMDELTREEVHAAVRRHLQTAKVKIALVTGQAAEMEKALLAGRASPPSYPTPKPQELLAEDREIAAFPLEIADVKVVPVGEVLER